eukprot:RCo032576
MLALLMEWRCFFCACCFTIAHVVAFVLSEPGPHSSLGVNLRNLANNLTCEVRSGIKMMDKFRYLHHRTTGPWARAFYGEECFYQRYGDVLTLHDSVVSFHLHGSGALTSVAAEPSEFTMTAAVKSGAALGQWFRPVLLGRLYGVSIVVVRLHQLNSSAWAGRFRPTDPGTHVLEIFLSWATLDVLARAVPYVGQLLFRVPHSVGPAVRQAVPGPHPSLPLCTPSTYKAAKARWLHVAIPNASTPWYSGNPSEVMDGFNPGYVWAPLGCRFHFYSQDQLQQCLRRCKMRDVQLDPPSSIGRGVMFNILGWLGTRVPPPPSPCNLSWCPGAQKITLNAVLFKKQIFRMLRRYGAIFSVDHTFNFSGESIRFRATPEGSPINGELFFLDPGVLSSVTPAYPVIRKRILQCLQALPADRCIVLVNPAVHRQDWRMAQPQHSYLSTVRYDIASAASDGVRQLVSRLMRHHAAASRPRVVMLDGFPLTEARWESTWDGMHYEVYWPAGHTHDWYGGGFWELSLGFFNLLGHPPCYGRL